MTHLSIPDGIHDQIDRDQRRKLLKQQQAMVASPEPFIQEEPEESILDLIKDMPSNLNDAEPSMSVDDVKQLFKQDTAIEVETVISSFEPEPEPDEIIEQSEVFSESFEQCESDEGLSVDIKSENFFFDDEPVAVDTRRIETAEDFQEFLGEESGEVIEAQPEQKKGGFLNWFSKKKSPKSKRGRFELDTQYNIEQEVEPEPEITDELQPEDEGEETPMFSDVDLTEAVIEQEQEPVFEEKIDTEPKRQRGGVKVQTIAPAYTARSTRQPNVKKGKR